MPYLSSTSLISAHRGRVRAAGIPAAAGRAEPEDAAVWVLWNLGSGPKEAMGKGSSHEQQSLLAGDSPRSSCASLAAGRSCGSCCWAVREPVLP